MDKTNVELFQSRFARPGWIYAKQGKGSNSRAFYPARTNGEYETVTEKVIQRHLSGKQVIGIYLLHPQKSTAVFGALDFDNKDTTPVLATHQAAKKLGIHAYIVTSTSKGFHLYIFFDVPVPGKDVRSLYQLIIRNANTKPAPEIFPKQDRLSETTPLGSLIKLPLSQPLVKKGRCAFVNPENEFQPYSDQWAFLESTKTNSKSMVKNAIATTRRDKPLTDPAIRRNLFFNERPPCVNKILGGVTEGFRNEVMFRAATYFKSAGLSQDEVSTLLDKANQKNQPPLGLKEINQIVKSAFSKDYPGDPCGSETIRANFCDDECGLVPELGTATARNRIELIRSNAIPGKVGKLKAFERDRMVAEVIREDLKFRGSFYNDKQFAYYFNQNSKQLILVHQDSNELMLLLASYGLNRTENLFRYVLEDVYRTAFADGIETQAYRLSFYDKENNKLYLYDHANMIYRITTDTIDLVDNGTDGVLFIADPENLPFEVPEGFKDESLLDVEIFSKTNLIKDVLTPDERCVLLILWFYAIFFESIMPTKPLLAFIGEKGSGKTTTLRLIGNLLFGENFDVASLTADPSDFDATVTNSAFAVIDNADSKHRWLNDKLATAATGGKVRKRELYTTNKLVDFPIRCFLAVTSRTPNFRRDDVADRLLIMKVARLDRFISESRLRERIVKNRNNIMAEVLGHIQEILRAMKDGWDRQLGVAFRMADFAEFSLTIARHAGIYDEMQSIFKKLSQEQSYFTLEDDPIFDLLSDWLESSENNGREVTAAELYDIFSDTCDRKGIDFAFKSVVSFSMRLNNMLDNLRTFFKVTKRAGHAGRTHYSFTHLDESKLSIF